MLKQSTLVICQPSTYHLIPVGRQMPWLETGRQRDSLAGKPPAMPPERVRDTGQPPDAGVDVV